jgi:hypothetical protein
VGSIPIVGTTSTIYSLDGCFLFFFLLYNKYKEICISRRNNNMKEVFEVGLDIIKKIQETQSEKLEQTGHLMAQVFIY